MPTAAFSPQDCLNHCSQYRTYLVLNRERELEQGIEHKIRTVLLNQRWQL